MSSRNDIRESLNEDNNMTRLDLCGKWKVLQKNEGDAIKATVPGCIHTDLLTARRIEDPYYRDNEDKQMWIGETDWTYERRFDVEADLLNRRNIILICYGLDTLADIKINGKSAGTADNQFRTWEFDIKKHLIAGENVITVHFASTSPYIRRKQKERYLYHWGTGQDRAAGGNRVRKSQCNYGWDWGPKCVTAGIWRPIEIIAFDESRISDVHIRQNHRKKNKVELTIEMAVQKSARAALSASIAVRRKGKAVVCKTVAVAGSGAKAVITVENPELWWPNGMGQQPLYEVTISLMNGKSKIDGIAKTIGLRTLTLRTRDDKWGQSFEFAANGKPFFSKGANWIPADTFVNRVSPADYEDLISSAAQANMNMLRVWGGGIYEPDLFYDLCDKYGICIWQDFMFACSAYPAHDTSFMQNVKAEIADNVRRLRHHPSIAFWCGNNEIEQGFGNLIGDDKENGQMNLTEYKSLFDKLIPKIVADLDPDRRYWPSSPHTPTGDRTDFNNPDSGDAHLWSVWHGREPFEWYRTCEHRFNSEFGFQSFPEPGVVETFTEPADRNITSYIMEKHQRSGIGNDAIIQYMLDWFQLPTSHEMILWTSQILQGMAIKYAVEHWRRQMPRGMGTLYWQLNDCWPVASWSSIDYFHNWKALHYMARDFYAPLLISALENDDKESVDIYITNDLLDAVSLSYIWTLTTAGGKVVAKGNADVDFPPQKSRKTETLKLGSYVETFGIRNLILWLELKHGTKLVSKNTAVFVRPKHLQLEKPNISQVIKERNDGGFSLTLKTDKPALWVWPDVKGIQAKYSDRFFHLRPGKPITSIIEPALKLTGEKLEKLLRISSIFDTYQ